METPMKSKHLLLSTSVPHTDASFQAHIYLVAPEKKGITSLSSASRNLIPGPEMEAHCGGCLKPHLEEMGRKGSLKEGPRFCYQSNAGGFQRQNILYHTCLLLPWRVQHPESKTHYNLVKLSFRQMV